MSDDSSTQEHLDRVVLATARPLSLGFGLYIAYTAAREWNDYTGRDFAIVVGADLFVATYLLALAAWLWLRPPPLGWMNGLGASIGLVLGGTDMATMAVNGIPAFPATALVYAGLGAVVLSWRWLLGTLGLLWAGWIIITQATTPDPWAAQFILQVSTVLGLAIHGGRMRAYRTLINARLNEARVRRRLQRLNEELDRFSAVVAHDLQNPVTAIRLKVAALKIRARDDVEQGQTLGEVERIADSMARLIASLLAYARAGQPVEAMSDVPLRNVVGHVLDVFTGRVDEAGGRIETGPLPTVRGDETLLFQVFENLVGNAISYGRPNTPIKVRITAAPSESGTTISIQDNGLGFDEAEAERLFLPFERGDTEAPGHGLGLATCRRIMEQHGGRIEVASKPGEGATFSLFFPDEALGNVGGRKG